MPSASTVVCRRDRYTTPIVARGSHEDDRREGRPDVVECNGNAGVYHHPGKHRLHPWLAEPLVLGKPRVREYCLGAGVVGEPGVIVSEVAGWGMALGTGHAGPRARSLASRTSGCRVGAHGRGVGSISGWSIPPVLSAGWSV